MVIKFIKATKTNRVGQVVEGDYKKLIHQVKEGNAVVSNDFEMSEYKAKLSMAHSKTARTKAAPPKSEAPPRQKPIKDQEPCLPCQKKKNKK